MSFSRLIRSCTEASSNFYAKSVHARIIMSGFNPDVQTNNHLLTMYCNLGNIDYVEKLFGGMRERNIYSWTPLISAYSSAGFAEKSLHCFRSMVLEDGIAPNGYTYVAVISACARIRALRIGQEVHRRIFRSGENVNSFVTNCLVNFYGKCGSLKLAAQVFDAIVDPGTISCVSFIASCVQCGENERGLRVFLRCLRMGVKMNEFCYESVLGACAALEILEVGMEVQCVAIKCGVKMDQFVITGLVNFYAKCGELESARRALKEAEKPGLTAWTALIGGCVQLGRYREAICFFQEFLSTGLRPNELTFASVLGAFAKEKETWGGLQLHSLIIKFGFKAFTLVSNSILDFYSKIDRLDQSSVVFSEMDIHDNVSWNALIAGFINSGCFGEATELIQNMFSHGFDPDPYTYSSLLSICGDLPAIEWGKQIHCCIIKPGFDSNVVVGSSLIDMYAKCGRLDDSWKVFNILPNKNLISWNAIISGYAQHGFGREALDTYKIMLQNGIKPNDITFIAVLSSCGHVGSLTEGLHHFESMTKEFEIIPKTDHLACMVSLFSRKGQTREAYDFITSFSVKPDKVVWRCLLSGCITNKDLEFAKYAAEMILSIDPDDTSAHIILSNIYADSNMWKESSQVRKIMKEKALKKETGYSWTELRDKVVCFSADDCLKLQCDDLRKVLSGLSAQLLDEGCIPDYVVSFG
ncbi:pentatricopeptide repeat-containing protein mitochondrial-like [Dorcoceras hygrometricum]|uniref:Pentatricopeptide repeat-containing protein mitochondrial-like n=1 Tax=Dorcoceras hygrometricum TaxID=472368 RepID=A0A2Z7DD53_9LAMI|nr:pentatricopeptide repeat-containing protein mitochondrial-like [Dorcoceras hygrometricum]